MTALQAAVLDQYLVNKNYKSPKNLNPLEKRETMKRKIKKALYKNKYRNDSTRLKGWDYRNDGAYYITICTKDRIHHFGSVENGEMFLSEIGKLADEFWAEIPQHFPFVKLDEFVIMPNHTHGILVIDKNRSSKNGDGDDDTGTGTKPPIVDPPKNQQMQKISPKPGSISTIIRSFKSVTTKHARKIQPNFAWQPRFHDHIIRNQLSHNNIRNYIKNNPQQWKEDRFYNGL